MQRVIERILNLLAYLLTVERPVTADEIRNTVAGYDRDNDIAFHRTFERDKDLLRRLGIPIGREATDVFEVEFGYVVSDDDYALQDPELTDEERTALALAVQAVGFGGRPAGQEALMKLGGVVGSLEGTQLGADLGESAEMVAEAFNAVSQRRLLTLDYRGSTRTIRPYGLVHRRGHWYLVGSGDRADETRVYRLDRATALESGSRTEAFEPPIGLNPADEVLHHPWDAGDGADVATVVFDEEVAWIAERELGSRATVTHRTDGSIEAEIEIAATAAFLGWLVGFEEHAELTAPADLRERFVSYVEGIR
ncbi:MAG: WYL domain-containing protein [Actinomycetota bacterium]|nr:WYL domain-containing protein [Actinomycetota bacterium]